MNTLKPELCKLCLVDIVYSPDGLCKGCYTHKKNIKLTKLKTLHENKKAVNAALPDNKEQKLSPY